MRLIYDNAGIASVVIPAPQFLAQLTGTDEEKMIHLANKILPTGTKYEIIGDDRTALSPPSVYANIVTGDVAVVFLTNDIDGITNQLRNAGYLLISPPMVLYAREDAQVQDREMLFRDRDGVLVNLIEFGNPRPEWSMPASE